MPRLELVPCGPAAAVALERAIDDAKAGDPLRPVTVAVPSPYAGLALRRLLATAPGRSGLVNVRFMALARVAELLGAPALVTSRRGPLTTTLESAAIRAVLAEAPGGFARVAHHAATERSLATAFRDLRGAGEPAVRRLEGRGGRPGEVARLYRRFRTLTAAYYTVDDVLEEATVAVGRASAALGDLGTVVVHAPTDLTAAEQSLLAALAGVDACRVILVLTGDARADAPTHALAARLAASLGPAPRATGPAAGPTGGTAIVDAPEPDDEVREVLRGIARRLDAGVPLHRMAVLFRNAEPYARLIHEHLDAAGIPWNGPASRTLAGTVAGRALVGLLALRDRDLHRDEVAAWLAAAPIRETRAGPVVPASRWDALARRAGVVAGLDQWATRLGRLARQRAADLEVAITTGDASDGSRSGLVADIEHLERLERFVAGLAAALEPGVVTRWSDLARWAIGLLDRYVDAPSARLPWPEAEQRTYDEVRDRIVAIGAVGDLGGRPELATFRRAVAVALDDQLGSVGHFGNGVFVGRVRDAPATDFETVFVVGMTEGTFPPRARDDPLLPDRARAAAGGLPMAGDRDARERREYLAALAAAPERVLTFARVDSRGRREQQPSRWLVETASALAGARRFAHELRADRGAPWLTVLDSFEAAIAHTDAPASIQEFDLRSLTRWRRDGRPAGAHPLASDDPVLGAGFTMLGARRSEHLTGFDGLVDPSDDLVPDPTHPVSPTALETYATCPFRYLLGSVLRVAEVERPEELDTISPLARGALVHAVLCELVETAPPRTSPEQPWTHEERALLGEIARRQFDDAVASGLTGAPLLWSLERRRLLRELDTTLDTDEEVRAALGVVPVGVEVGFGLGQRGHDVPPVRFETADGVQVAFKGRIDRVDRSPTGDRLAVLDYKTGSGAPYRSMKSDPLARGTRLQLAVYGLAARARWGDVPVDAAYWFTRRRGVDQLVRYELDDEVLARLRQVLHTIVEGIAHGRFPARPGPETNGDFEHCRSCAFDRVCPADRGRVWSRKRTDPSLHAYLALAEPDDRHDTSAVAGRVGGER